MELGLKGKKVLVSGGTRGIGRAMVEVFLAEGAEVSLCARDALHVTSAVEELSATGATVHGFSVDVGDHAALRQWVDASVTRMNGLDIVVANPSAFGIGSTAQDWDAGYRVDLMGTVHLMEAALPHMEIAANTHGDASMLAIASALVGETESESAYGAFKAGLVHYTKGLARRVAPKSVRVNIVSPGTIFVDGGFWDNAKKHMPEVYSYYLKNNPMDRMGCPKEVAKAAVFLCSPAASFVTGANLVIDGAWTRRVNF